MKRSDRILNEVKFSFPSRSENESFARMAVSGFVSQLDPQIDELSDIKTAVSEAVTNCIVHGYKNTLGIVTMTARLLVGNEVYIKITDKGCGIEDIEAAMTPLYTSAPDQDRAGLGFTIMESFMDSLSVKSKLGKGTSVTMRKKLTTRKASDENRRKA